MIPLSEALLLLVLLGDFAVLGASRLTFTIRITAFQGFLLGMLPERRQARAPTVSRSSLLTPNTSARNIPVYEPGW